jgi:hypothetical protein
LESVLNSEIRTLGYPRAALLAFSIAVLAYNVLAVLQAAGFGKRSSRRRCRRARTAKRSR